MDFNKLRPLEKRIEIISLIEKASEFGGDIWQNGTQGREIFQVIQISIDIHDRFILRTNAMVSVDQRYPIFVRLSYRNIIFRLEPREFKVQGDKIICKYPDEIRALEPRKGNRYVLPFEQDISLSLKRAGRSVRDNAALEIEVRIIDVSESGFGILISGANRDFLKPYDHFWIKAVDHRPLSYDIFGTVLYVAPKGYYLKKHDVRVGLRLTSALSWDTFDYLKRKCRVILSA